MNPGCGCGASYRILCNCVNLLTFAFPHPREGDATGVSMDRKSMERTKLDQRLIRRRNWIAQEELERELKALPDVSHKIASPEEPGDSEAGSEEPPVE